jgi:hypothetical protein
MARARPSKRDPKEEALARDGALNPRLEAVLDPLFLDNQFFDPRDLVQVRYEMVRRHQADGQSIRDAADVFGVSRPTFYKAQSALADQGLAGLLLQQRGPKSGHKISLEVIASVPFRRNRGAHRFRLVEIQRGGARRAPAYRSL